MSISRFLAHMRTDSGRTTCRIAMTTAMAGYILAKFIPGSFGLGYSKSILSAYKDGEPVKMDAETNECFNEAMKYAEVKKYQEDVVEPFVAHGFEMYSMGFFDSNFGAILAIPHNFTFDRTSFHKDLIRINTERLDWSKDEAADFYDSLYFSKDAKTFAITREFEYLKTFKFFTGLLEPIYLFAFYNVSTHLSDYLKMREKKMLHRISLYLLMSIVCLSSFYLIKDSYQNYIDKTIDKKLAEKSESLRKGGEEYYRKLLQRNVALRELMGSSGKRRFYDNGNEKGWIRQRHFPLVDRKLFFSSEQTN